MAYFHKVTPQEQQNKDIYHSTLELCKTHPYLVETIKSTKEAQKVYLETEELSLPDPIRTEETKVLVTNKRSFEAAMGYSDDEKVCVLNFASFTKAGGGVAYGKGAQEECLCQRSTLMPCIDTTKMKNEFYLPHKELNNNLYNDDIIYSPGVVIVKEDTWEAKPLPEDAWKKVDVITCAAPNFGAKPSNRYNPCSGDKPIHLSREEHLELMKKRIERVFEVAYLNGVDVLILGAWGCGAFHNRPQSVAEAFAYVISQHKNWFKTIEFAIVGGKDADNCAIFKSILDPSAVAAKEAVSKPAEPVKLPEIPDIVGQKLTHSKFGDGTVVKVEDKYITVNFGTEKKMMLEFLFSGLAHLEDKELDGKMYEIAKVIKG